MWKCLRACAALLYLSLGASSWLASAQDREQTASLVLQFRETPNVSEKELILARITQLGHGAGQQLLQLAKTTDDNDTRWLTIRGLGTLKFRKAARRRSDRTALFLGDPRS
jgi:hypothetical protein